jgi:hypothetical protein
MANHELVVTDELVEELFRAELAKRAKQQEEQPPEPTVYESALTGQTVIAYHSDLGKAAIERSKRPAPMKPGLTPARGDDAMMRHFNDFTRGIGSLYGYR